MRKERPLNRNKLWTCPYFAWDSATCINGECGKVSLKLRTYCVDYETKYCAGNWEACTLAQQLNTYYELEADINARKKGTEEKN